MSYSDIEVYFYEGMTYQDLGLDPDFNYVDYSDDDCSYDDDNNKDDKAANNTEDKNEIEPKQKDQKIKDTEESNLVIKQLSVCQSNVQLRNKTIKILLNMNIENYISYYAKYEYLPTNYVNLAKEKNCLETLVKSFLKTHLHYDLTSSVVNEINSLLYIIYNNIDGDIVYNRVKKIQKFIHEKTDIKYGCNAYLQLSPKAMRKLLSTSRLHLNIFDAKTLEPEILISIIEKSTNEHFKHNKTKFTFSGKKAKRDNSKDFESLARMDSSLNLAIEEIYNLDLSDEIVSYRESILSIFESYSC